MLWRADGSAVFSLQLVVFIDCDNVTIADDDDTPWQDHRKSSLLLTAAARIIIVIMKSDSYNDGAWCEIS